MNAFGINTDEETQTEMGETQREEQKNLNPFN